jgi:hypothetical protein
MEYNRFLLPAVGYLPNNQASLKVYQTPTTTNKGES